MSETVKIIVHGSGCPEWTNPQTPDEWFDAQLVKGEVEPGDWMIDEAASGVWRCPFCRQAVYIFYDFGTLDLGVQPTNEEKP